MEAGVLIGFVISPVAATGVLVGFVISPVAAAGVINFIVFPPEATEDFVDVTCSRDGLVRTRAVSRAAYFF